MVIVVDGVLVAQVSLELCEPPMQVHPASTEQVLLQPSPLMVFPSSHVKMNRLPSPHISLQELANPDAVIVPWAREKPLEQPVQMLLVKQETQ